MSDIKNITLAFPCREKLERNNDGFYCHKCAHSITDFRCQSAGALQAAMQSGRPVCGIFNRSQLSGKFARYTAVAAIATTTLATTMCASDPQSETTPVNTTEEPKLEVIEDMGLVGIVIPPEPDSASNYVPVIIPDRAGDAGN